MLLDPFSYGENIGVRLKMLGGRPAPPQLKQRLTDLGSLLAELLFEMGGYAMGHEGLRARRSAWWLQRTAETSTPGKTDPRSAS